MAWNKDQDLNAVGLLSFLDACQMACFLFKLLVSGSLSTALVHMVSKEAPAGVPAAVKITAEGV